MKKNRKIINIINELVQKESFEIADLFYLGKKIGFTELYYLNGPKLSINIENQYILFWNNEFESYETWFLIKCSQNIFEQYLLNNISLLDVIKNCIFINLIKRNYEEYDILNIKATNINNNSCSEEIYKLENFLLPTEKSFLMIDFKKNLLEKKLEKV